MRTHLLKIKRRHAAFASSYTFAYQFAAANDGAEKKAPNAFFTFAIICKPNDFVNTLKQTDKIFPLQARNAVAGTKYGPHSPTKHTFRPSETFRIS